MDEVLLRIFYAEEEEKIRFILGKRVSALVLSSKIFFSTETEPILKFLFDVSGSAATRSTI